MLGKEESAVLQLRALTGADEARAVAMLEAHNGDVSAATNHFFDVAGKGDSEGQGEERAEKAEDEHDEQAELFCAVTGANKATARGVLAHHDWVLHNAVNAFLDAADNSPPPSPPSSPASSPAPQPSPSPESSAKPGPIALCSPVPFTPPRPPAPAHDGKGHNRNKPGASSVAALARTPFEEAKEGGGARDLPRVLQDQGGAGGAACGVLARVDRRLMHESGGGDGGGPSGRRSLRKVAQAYPHVELASRRVIVRSQLPLEWQQSASVMFETLNGDDFSVCVLGNLRASVARESIRFSELQQLLQSGTQTVDVLGITFKVKMLVALLERKFVSKFQPVGVHRVDLFGALMGWESLNKRTVKDSVSQDVLDCLPLICSALAHAPMALQSQMNNIAAALAERARQDPHIAQAVDFAVRSSTDARNIFADTPRNTHAFDLLSATLVSKFWDRRVERENARDRKAQFYTEAGGLGEAVLVQRENGPVGIVVDVPRDQLVFHPFHYFHRIKSFRVERTFKSNARPAVLSITSTTHNQDTIGTRVILKKGDDLRQDVACLSLFKVLNRIWRKENLAYNGHAVMAPTFRCVAIAEDVGLYEFVEQSETLKDFDFSRVVDGSEGAEAVRDEIIATAAGSFMAAWILGVGDRHNENILVTESGRLYHTDFGYILGNRVMMDTGPFAITPSLKAAMGDAWDEFVTLTVTALQTLQPYNDLITRMAVDLLGYFNDEAKVRAYVREALQGGENDDEPARAHPEIRRLLHKAPRSIRTRAKNTMHTFAQKMK